MANDWDDTVKAKMMPTLLEGKALAVYIGLVQRREEGLQSRKAEGYRSTGSYEAYILGRIPCQEITPRRILVGLSPHAQTDADPSHARVRRRYMAAAAAPPVFVWPSFYC